MSKDKKGVVQLTGIITKGTIDHFSVVFFPKGRYVGMAGQSVIDRYRALFETSVLACHGARRKGTFRQRDLRFFLDLFANWSDPFTDWSALPISNTHISRYLQELVQQRLLYERHNSKKNYRFNADGLLSVLKSLIGRSYIDQPQLCSFVPFFLAHYFRPFIEVESRKEGKRHAQYYQRLYDYSNPRIFLELQVQQVRAVESAYERYVQMQKEVSAELALDQPAFQVLDDVASYFEDTTMYWLHSRKPIRDLLKGGTIERVQLELNSNRIYRLNELWQPTLDRIQLLRRQLEHLQEVYSD